MLMNLMFQIMLFVFAVPGGAQLNVIIKYYEQPDK